VLTAVLLPGSALPYSSSCVDVSAQSKGDAIENDVLSLNNGEGTAHTGVYLSQKLAGPCYNAYPVALCTHDCGLVRTADCSCILWSRPARLDACHLADGRLRIVSATRMRCCRPCPRREATKPLVQQSLHCSAVSRPMVPIGWRTRVCFCCSTPRWSCFCSA